MWRWLTYIIFISHLGNRKQISEVRRSAGFVCLEQLSSKRTKKYSPCTNHPIFRETNIQIVAGNYSTNFLDDHVATSFTPKSIRHEFSCNQALFIAFWASPRLQANIIYLQYSRSMQICRLAALSAGDRPMTRDLSDLPNLPALEDLKMCRTSFSLLLDDC